jgi:hypothetical protein
MVFYIQYSAIIPVILNFLYEHGNRGDIREN